MAYCKTKVPASRAPKYPAHSVRGANARRRHPWALCGFGVISAFIYNQPMMLIALVIYGAGVIVAFGAVAFLMLTGDQRGR
jgi:hypothetical protein